MIQFNDIQNINLCGCNPKQIITFNTPINFDDIPNIKIYNKCDEEYPNSSFEYAYSIDSVCWSCFVSYNDILLNTVNIKQDLYIKIKVAGVISKILVNCCPYTTYNVVLDSAFKFSYCSTESPNMYNPYANMSCAVELQKHMTDLVCCMFGIPIYYFRLNPNQGSKDVTFKEYTLMEVEPPKQIKLMVQDGLMPSSKPEFNDFGLDWQTDWETEIGKTMFATAFGQNAQPMEGDFIYIPMMKRMWQVSGAYEEKKEALMWNATTFKVSLVKYEERGNVDLGNLDDMVNSFVKNTYDDLFGDDNEDTAGTGSESVDAPLGAFDNLLPVFQSDATRKYVTCSGINIFDNSTYYKGTLISDAWYMFKKLVEKQKIVYQKQYCGNDITICFIFKPLTLGLGETFEGTLLEIGTLKINIYQDFADTIISVNKDKNLSLTISSGNTYFVYIRWSKDLNIAEIGAALYTYNQSIPIYKLQSGNYYYDMDNINNVTSNWNIEYTIDKKCEVILNSFIGNITNIKLFDIYNDNLSEMLQQYPTNNRLIINDTARKLIGLDGLKIR
jgi:hypothetical protein